MCREMHTMCMSVKYYVYKKIKKKNLKNVYENINACIIVIKVVHGKGSPIII